MVVSPSCSGSAGPHRALVCKSSSGLVRLHVFPGRRAARPHYFLTTRQAQCKGVKAIQGKGGRRHVTARLWPAQVAWLPMWSRHKRTATCTRPPEKFAGVLRKPSPSLVGHSRSHDDHTDTRRLMLSCTPSGDACPRWRI
jgi:hypothetical protein